MKITKVSSCGLFLESILTRIEICDDVREECSKYGQVLELKIPRPTGGSRQSPGVGKIFVKFDTIESTTAALKALAGRKFSDRTVVTTYFSEVSPP
jgi:splicing factor U2AF subunit